MRALAWLLAGYAVIGVVFIVVALLVGAPLVSRLDRITTSALDTMSAATAAADAAADAFGGFDASITQARQSATDAATLSRETASTLDGLADAMSLSLLGTQPLLPLAGEFGRSAEQMRQMGDSLDGIGQALAGNRDDIARVGIRMRTLADRLNGLQERIGAERLAAGLPLSWLFYGFLVWQLLPIGAAGVGAAWIFRHPPVTMKG